MLPHKIVTNNIFVCWTFQIAHRFSYMKSISLQQQKITVHKNSKQAFPLGGTLANSVYYMRCPCVCLSGCLSPHLCSAAASSPNLPQLQYKTSWDLSHYFLPQYGDQLTTITSRVLNSLHPKIRLHQSPAQQQLSLTVLSPAYSSMSL